MLKTLARKQLLEKRNALSSSDCLKLDDLLLIQLQKLNWSEVQTLGSFYPLEHHNEPNSLLLTKYLKMILPGLIVAYPRVNGNQMDFFEETVQLEFNQWGIPEPEPTHFISPNHIDLVLVPLVGFDAKGQRIGFGKGYYDRFFEKFPSHKERIGISYFDPIENIEDTHEFDVPLTKCITPWNIYEF